MKSFTSAAFSLLIAIGVCIGSMLLMGFQKDDVALSIVANEKGAPAKLSLKELKALVQGDKQRWPDGTKISLAFMKTSTPAGMATAQKLLSMSGDEFNKHWLALVFQGKAKAPTFFSTAQELDNYVSSTPGALGIVESGANTKSRQVNVDDKKSF